MPFSELIDGAALVAVLDAARSALVAIDHSGRIGYANPSAVEAFGYPREELVGQPVELLVPEDVREAHVRVRQAFSADPAPRGMGVGMDLRARRKDGSTFPVEIALTPVDTPGGRLVLASVVDISRRLEAERSARSLSRVHLALAELNDGIARATDPAEVVEAGRRAFATLDESTTAMVVPGTRTPGRSVGGGALLAPDVEAAIEVVRTQRKPCFGPSTSVHGQVAILPIERQDRLEACLVVESASDIFDDPSVRTVLTTMATNLSLALERLEQRERLRRVDAQRIELLRRLVVAQEEERSRIAGDVHDDSVQALAALQLRVGFLQQRTQDAPELAAALDHLQAELVRVMGGLRELLFELESIDPGSSLVDVVQDVLDRAPMGDVAVRALEVDWGDLEQEARADSLLDLSPDLRAQAARILKEALHNVTKHAEATWVQVVVSPSLTGVGIRVVDDGVGFPAPVAELRSAPGHRGLSGMRDRAELAGGWARLERDEGLTTLAFWLPRDGT